MRNGGTAEAVLVREGTEMLVGLGLATTLGWADQGSAGGTIVA